MLLRLRDEERQDVGEVVGEDGVHDAAEVDFGAGELKLARQRRDGPIAGRGRAFRRRRPGLLRSGRGVAFHRSGPRKCETTGRGSPPVIDSTT